MPGEKKYFTVTGRRKFLKKYENDMNKINELYSNEYQSFFDLEMLKSYKDDDDTKNDLCTVGEMLEINKEVMSNLIKSVYSVRCRSC